MKRNKMGASSGCDMYSRRGAANSSFNDSLSLLREVNVSKVLLRF